MQRGGHGKALFEMMLQVENTSAEKLGYDRPSEKLIAFLAKHYGLKKYVPQNNNFVVFDAYFGGPSSTTLAS
jgi:alpha-tubulin N-acetyltransferase 1